MSENSPVLISACLIGIRSRYDGSDARREELLRELDGITLIPVCPEQLGGLPTPRPKAEIERGDGSWVLDGKSRVIDEDGCDRTASFIKGAEEVLRIAHTVGATRAILKEKSPSCGVRLICREEKEVEGYGVTTALLKRAGVRTEGVL